MRKIFKRACVLALVCAMTVQPMTGSLGIRQVSAAGVADQFEIPAADANGRIGAQMPYTRYDSTVAAMGGGAALKTSTDWDPYNIATQASEQSYVRLPGSGAYAEWTMKTTGSGVTMRFTMPDSADGRGLKGSVDVYVNGTKVISDNNANGFFYYLLHETNIATYKDYNKTDDSITSDVAWWFNLNIYYDKDSIVAYGYMMHPSDYDDIRVQITEYLNDLFKNA